MAPRPQNQKRRPEPRCRANRIIQTRTLLLLGVFGVLTFVRSSPNSITGRSPSMTSSSPSLCASKRCAPRWRRAAGTIYDRKRHHPRDVRLGGGYFLLSEGDHRK